MQFARYSNLKKRLKCKKYQINYLEIFISLFIKHGKKKYAKKKIFLLFVLLKKFFFFNSQFKAKVFLNKNTSNYFLSFITKVLDSYRPKVSLVYKKAAANIYWIPWYINITKSRVMLIRWLFQSAIKRVEKNFVLCLYYELLDLFNFRGLTVRRLEEYYDIAILNRPYLRMLQKKRKISRSRLRKYRT